MAVLTAGSFLMIGADSATDAFEGDGTKTSFTLSKTASANPTVSLTVAGSAVTTGFTVSGKNLTGPDFLKRKDSIVAALEHEIEHGDMEAMAVIRKNKRSL